MGTYRYQYMPDMSVRYSPRVAQSLWRRINKLCSTWDMPEADVMRYTFEAVVRGVWSGKIRLAKPDKHAVLGAMVTVRTSRTTAAKVRDITKKQIRTGKAKNKAEVLRGLIETAIQMANKKGMAHMLSLRGKRS